MTQLLLVEDDELLGNGITKVLSQRGERLNWVRTGQSALSVLQKDQYDLILLDLNLPDITGFDILETIRAEKNDIPILVLTARGSIDDRVHALDSGADDYLTKPFDINELCARIRALRRRSCPNSSDIIHYRNLVIDTRAKYLCVSGQPTELSAKEFSLLEILVAHMGRVMTRRDLETNLYGWDADVASNAIEVHIHNLRKKTSKDIIRTIRGVGYIVEK